MNSEIELYLQSGYKNLVITSATKSSIQVRLDYDNWIAISLNIPYTINVTDVNVIRFKTGSGVSYPITLTCDLISTVYILSASSSLDNGKFL